MKLQRLHLIKLGEFYEKELNALFSNEFIYDEKTNKISFLFE